MCPLHSHAKAYKITTKPSHIWIALFFHLYEDCRYEGWWCFLKDALCCQTWLCFVTLHNLNNELFTWGKGSWLKLLRLKWNGACHAKYYYFTHAQTLPAVVTELPIILLSCMGLLCVYGHCLHALTRAIRFECHQSLMLRHKNLGLSLKKLCPLRPIYTC